MSDTVTEVADPRFVILAAAKNVGEFAQLETVEKLAVKLAQVFAIMSYV